MGEGERVGGRAGERVGEWEIVGEGERVRVRRASGRGSKGGESEWERE